MELNDKNLEVLSAGLKMTKEDLTKALLENVDLDLSNKVIYEKDDYDKLIKNLSNQEYHKGKEAGTEMPLKDAKKFASETFGIETEGIKDYNSLLDLVVKERERKLKETLKDGANKNSEKYLSEKAEFEKTITGLRDKLQESQSEYEKKLSDQKSENERYAINNDLIKYVKSLPLDVPKSVLNEGKEAEMKFLNKQHNNLLTLLRNKFTFELSEGKLIFKNDNGIVKNDLLEPEKPENIILDFAKSNYINIKDNKFINRSDSKKYGNVFPGMSIEQFNTLMKDKGIRPHSQEYYSYKSQWKKVNK